MKKDKHAEDNLEAYLKVVLQIHDYIASDPGRYRKFKKALKRRR